MRSTIRYVDPTHPIINRNTAIPTDFFRIFLLDVYQRGLLIGTGSPDGVVEAQQGVEYMDENGLAGSVKWIKQQADIGGDKSLGWVAIG